jgi:sugar phosphate isomerase/epimerase
VENRSGRFCINGATTMPYSLIEDIEAAGAAGFEAVEIWHRKLLAYLEGRSAADLRTLLQVNHLAVAAICPLFVQFGAEAVRARDAIAQAADVAADLDCPTLLVCLRQPPEGLSPFQALELAAEETARCADIAAGRGIGLAIEPLGRHPLVPGPREALALIEMANRPNLGLMLDTFHYYKSDVPLTEIASLPLEKVRIIHVNDCEDRPREELRDAHRLFPTLGVIPAVEMLRPLYQRGYPGYLSIEIFREEYWSQPVEEITNRAKHYLNQLMARIVAQ